MLQFENLKIEAVNKETFLIEEGFFISRCILIFKLLNFQIFKITE